MKKLNFLKKIFVGIITSIFLLTFFISPVLAVDADDRDTSLLTGDCNEFGNVATGLCDNGNALTTLIKECALGTRFAGVITAILNVFFFLVLAFAVYSTLRASIKYIRSEGNEKMVGEAKAAMRSILLGVGAMFICVIIILFLQGIFGGTSATGSNGIASAIDGTIKPILQLIGLCN